MIRRAAFRVFAVAFSMVFGTRVARVIWKIPGSRTLYRWLMTRLRPTQVTIDGHTMRLDAMDSLLLSVNGAYEQAELDLFTRCISPGDTVLDIGAHIGLYTLQAARAVGPTGMVHAFEPATDNYKLLDENIKVNGYHNVKLTQAAVADQPGQVYLTISEVNSGDNSLVTARTRSRKTETVAAVTIDDYMANQPCDRVDVMKMDIQGAEPAALVGAFTTITRNDDMILFTELSPAHLAEWGGTAHYLTLLTEAGFSFFEINEDAADVEARSGAELAEAHAGADTSIFTNLVCVKGTQAFERFWSASIHR